MSRRRRASGAVRVAGRAVGPGLALVAVLAMIGGGCGHEGGRSRPVAAAGAESTAAEGEGTIYSAASLPIPPLGYGAREGRVLYRRYCMTCHGEAGMGDGFNAYNLDPRPRSLADSTFQAQHSDSDLVTAIRSGGGAVGLSAQMPPWGRTLSERQIEQVVEYVRTLRETGESDP